VIRVASLAGGALPAGPAHALARAGGTVEWAVRPAKRRILAENLGHAVGLPPHDLRVRALVRREVVNEARRSVDLLWALRRPHDLRTSTSVTGSEHIHEALAGKHGVILSSLHLGGWEVATAIPAAVVPVATTAIVEDDWLAWAIDPFRAAAGLARLYATAPAWSAAAVLRRGEALLVLGETDERATRRYRVRFLDAEAELPAGVVGLSRLCGAPIVPFFVLPDGPRQWRVQIERPLPPPVPSDGEAGERRQLQELADRWSTAVRRFPEHWAAVYPIRWVRQ
jgi:KDO2-lipid IV(A) lauroyltransferase